MEILIKNIDINKIKFLPVSKENLVLALDRLSRFKYPEIKYYRVISDLLCRYLIEPKISKNHIQELDVNIIKSLFERLWNYSVEKYSPNIPLNSDFNRVLIQEIYSTYNLSDDMKNLVDMDINIDAVLSYISVSEDTPINLRRLLLIQHDYKNLVSKRESLALRFPVEKVVLCEGITEEILLPKFAKLAGYDFDKYGVKLISAGGKNQVAKLYCELKDELKIPIFVLLDADALQTANNIDTVLRDIDSVYLIKHGEFEDIFSLNLIKRTINNRFKNICQSSISDFKHDEPMTKVLSEFFRLNELGDFQKAEFAKELAENLKYKTDLTEEILQIVEQIKKV